MRRKAIAVLGAVLVSTATFAVPAAAANGDLEVVASASPLFDVASSIGGTRTHVVDAVQADMFGDVPTSKHDEIAGADLVIRLAPGVQPKFDAEVQRLAPNAKVINVFDQFPAESGGSEPYLWQDPANMMVVSEVVRAHLEALDSEGAKDFGERQASWVQTMADVERLNSRTLSTCDRKSFVTTDPSLDRYAQRFGLRQVAADTAEPERALEAEKATTLFSRELVSLDVAKDRLDRMRVRSAVLDPMSGRSDQVRRGGGTYAVAMALNLDALREALGCEQVTLGDD